MSGQRSTISFRDAHHRAEGFRDRDGWMTLLRPSSRDCDVQVRDEEGRGQGQGQDLTSLSHTEFKMRWSRLSQLRQDPKYPPSVDEGANESVGGQVREGGE